jgi:hypothetical protein
MIPFFPMKTRFGFIAVMGLIFLSLFITVNAVSSNILPDTPYDKDLSNRMITLDPVGNHTSGDIFSIHGITSLPAGRKLVVSMHLGDCRVGYCIRSEHRGYTVVVNGSPGMNTWSYQLNTTGFWTVDDKGDRWAYDITVGDFQFVTVNDDETIYLFNQSEPAYITENSDLHAPGSQNLTPPSPVTTSSRNAQAGQKTPVTIFVPVAALAIIGMVMLGKKNR